MGRRVAFCHGNGHFLLESLCENAIDAGMMMIGMSASR